MGARLNSIDNKDYAAFDPFGEYDSVILITQGKNNHS